MCGRFSITVTKEELADYLIDYYGIDDFSSEINVPRYNVAPGQDIIAIINDGIKYRVGMMKWGFVPFFAKDEKIGYKMINAKAETLHEKVSFKDAFKNKRCLILANGFYEWKKENEQKIPMRIMLKSNNIFAMAGLWSLFKREDKTNLFTCTIITTNANETVSKIHDRMPVILTTEKAKLWLNHEIDDLNLLSSILIPSQEDMDSYQVSPLVNNPKNEKAEIINSI